MLSSVYFKAQSIISSYTKSANQDGLLNICRGWLGGKNLRAWAVIFLVIAIIIGIALIPQLNNYATSGALAPDSGEFFTY